MKWPNLKYKVVAKMRDSANVQHIVEMVVEAPNATVLTRLVETEARDRGYTLVTYSDVILDTTKSRQPYVYRPPSQTYLLPPPAPSALKADEMVEVPCTYKVTEVMSWKPDSQTT